MATFDCDVFFPAFDQSLFLLQDTWGSVWTFTVFLALWFFLTVLFPFCKTRFPGVPSEIQEENGIKYKFQVFKKKAGHVENHDWDKETHSSMSTFCYCTKLFDLCVKVFLPVTSLFSHLIHLLSNITAALRIWLFRTQINSHPRPKTSLCSGDRHHDRWWWQNNVLTLTRRFCTVKYLIVALTLYCEDLRCNKAFMKLKKSKRSRWETKTFELRHYEKSDLTTYNESVHFYVCNWVILSLDGAKCL